MPTMSVGRLALVPLLLSLTACRDDRTPPAAPGGGLGASPSTAPSSSVAKTDEPAPVPPDTDPPPPPAPAAPAAPPLSEARFSAFLADPKAKVTEDAFETALLRISACDAKPGTKWVPSCAPYADLLKVVAEHYRGGDGFPGAPALRHLRHPSFGVRATAVSFASAYVFEGERKPESERLYLDAMRSETEVEVLESLLRQSGPGAARDPALRSFVLRSLAHADGRARASALGVIARPDVVTVVPDAFLRLAAATAKGRGPLERAAGCVHVGKIDDPRAVPLLGALLADAQLPGDLRGACFEGLVNTWTGSPAPRRPSREGYELTVKELVRRPRSADAPDERGLRALTTLRAPRPTRTGFLSQKPPPEPSREPSPEVWNAAALSDALASIVLDEDAGPRARSTAGVVLVNLEERTKIAATIRALEQRGSPLGRRLADEIGKAVAGRDDPFASRR